MALRKCCCCIDLRRGSLISAYIILLYNLVMLALQCRSLASIYSMGQGVSEETRLMLYFHFTTLLLLSFTLNVLLQLLLTIVLIIGLHKNKAGPILVSLIIVAVLVGFNLVATCWIIVVYGARYDFEDWCYSAMYLAMKFIYIYFLCVCGSYCKKLRKERGYGETVNCQLYV